MQNINRDKIMEVIMIEKEAYYKMLNEFVRLAKEIVEKAHKEKEWIGEEEAKALLGIKSRTKMQQLRDSISIEFSQYGKIIQYSRKSILAFIERHRVKNNLT